MVYSLEDSKQDSIQLISEGYTKTCEWDNGEEVTYNIPVSNEQVERFYQEINNMEPESEMEVGVRNIILEEAEEFFGGNKNADDVCRIIQSRVIIYNLH